MSEMSFNRTTVIRLTVNGRLLSVEVNYAETLLSVLRDRLLLTGTKSACLQGECGACAVRVDGELVNSCLCLAMQADGAAIETVEGLELQPESAELQDSFLGEG